VIGNISLDSVFGRDSIIMEGVLKKPIQFIDKITDKILTLHYCWAISNLCRKDPLSRYMITSKLAITALLRVIDTEMITAK
jgi:hypothetical protein